MNTMYRLLITAFALLVFSIPDGYALTAGTTYTIEVAPINSNGTVGTTASTTTAVADSSEKVAFTFSTVPTSSTYNFLLITIKDPDGNTVRRAIVPAPSANDTTSLGLSLVTEDQTEAFLSAMQSAGSDNPIFVAFGMVILRTGALGAADLARVGTAGANAATAFQNKMTAEGMTAAELVTFKSGIVSRLGQFTALYKDAVDATTAAASAENRGKAAGLLMRIFIQASGDAGCPEDHVELALMAAGDSIGNDSSWAALPTWFKSSVDAEMSSAISKMRAEKALQKYSNALTTLNASSSQVTRYTAAANTLFTAMENAFKAFEALFADESSTPSTSDIQSAQNAINTAMQSAFSTFITNAASTDAEIDTMQAALISAFCNGDAGCTAFINNDNMFKFFTQGSAQVNWPIPMAVQTSFAASLQSGGGSMSYTRDTLAVPSMMSWLDSDDDSSNGVNSTRHDFGINNDNSASGDERNMPTTMASLFGLKEDVSIIEFAKFAAFSGLGSSPSMSAMEGVMDTFVTRLIARQSALGGTSNGTTALTAAQKRALVITSLSPDFD
ncbi:MAG: hypothetical protein HYS23_14395 [Geobacter sp.]|nr:hypothetical protein [Geobacter sp.]